MKDRRAQRNKSNIAFLSTFVGQNIKAIKRELYFFENELDKDSMGKFMITLRNNRSFVFKCDVDSESIHIDNGSFESKERLMAECPQFKWTYSDFITADQLDNLGKIIDVRVEYSHMDDNSVQTGCSLFFENKTFLHIWIFGSDSMFFELRPISIPENDVFIRTV